MSNLKKNNSVFVHFVGAGPGAKDLITIRGKKLLEQADLVLYAGSLVNEELLDYASEACRRVNTAALCFEEIMEEMYAAVLSEKQVVRLHSGDPSVYGAIREQMDWLAERNIAYDCCPGVSACFGAAASLGVEYTLPVLSQSLVITRMEGRTAVPEAESIESFAKHRATMAIYLSAGRLAELSERLIAGGYDPDTPAALVYKATWPEEIACQCTVAGLAEAGNQFNISHTALVLVGEVMGDLPYEKSKLYDKHFETGFRNAKGGDE